MSTFRHIFQISRRFCSQSSHKHIQVCILGTDTALGQSLTFLLKQNPTVSCLHLQGTSRIESVGLDLSHFDTRTRAVCYYDVDSVSNSVKGADIIVMAGLNTCTKKMSLAKLVMAEGVRVSKLAEICARYAPKAIMIVAVCPVSVTLPIVADVYRKTDWYNPGKLLGSAALVQLKANSLVGQYQSLDPQIVNVPIVGGPDLDCAMPLFTQATPVGVTPKDTGMLLEAFRKEIPQPHMSHAVGINRMITEIARGINGDFHANVMAYVRTNLVGTCGHLVCSVQIGRTGVTHNFGLQKLSRTDLTTLEETCLQLKAREEMASDLVNREDKCSLPAFLVREMEEEKSDKLGIIR